MGIDMERLEYKAELEWDGNVGSRAKVREFSFRIDTNTDGHNAGPNPTEYLLGAIGGCLIVNWGRLIKKMRLKVEGMEITVSGWRDRKRAPAEGVVMEEPEKKILRVKELAEKYGTVFNTVGAEKIKGEMEVIKK